MTNPLENLKIDYWYKMLPVIGGLTLVLSLTTKMQVADNSTVALVSIGVIFIGIGEWINHPLQTAVGTGYQITSYNRMNRFWGNLWDGMGAVLILCALYFYLS